MENTVNTKVPLRQRLLEKIKISLPEIIGLLVGAAGGFAYYKAVGCSSGSCPITSNPWISTIWGAAIGYLFGNMFNKNKKTEK